MKPICTRERWSSFLMIGSVGIGGHGHHWPKVVKVAKELCKMTFCPWQKISEKYCQFEQNHVLSQPWRFIIVDN